MTLRAFGHAPKTKVLWKDREVNTAASSQGDCLCCGVRMPPPAGGGHVSGREEVDRFGRRYRLDVFRFETEQLDSLHELALEIFVIEFA